MIYLFQHIWLYLLLASTVGAVVGWALKANQASRAREALIEKLRARLEVVELQRDRLEAARSAEPRPSIVPIRDTVSRPTEITTQTQSLESLQDLSDADRRRISNAGIVTADDLLRKCGAMVARTEIAEQVGVDLHDLSLWVIQADLMRIPSVDAEFAERMAEVGVTSMQALARQGAAALHSRLTDPDIPADGATEEIPDQETVCKWIELAVVFEPLIEE